MIEPQLADSIDNEIRAVEPEHLPIPREFEDWFLQFPVERRPETPPLRCPHPHCGGQLYADLVVPGLFELLCLLCSRLIGEVLESDLQVWAGQDAVTRAKRGSVPFLWVRDEGLNDAG